MPDAEALLYGIPNCDQVKKARIWLTNRGIAYRFHNFKKSGVDGLLLAEWEKLLGWQALLNRKGTTWRTLPDADKASVKDAVTATALMSTHPSLIKRPVVCVGTRCHAGFSESDYENFFKV